jgi:hypothetical protein
MGRMTDQAIRVVPAGWYDDPADASSVRWWNGVSWTEHTNLKPQTVATPAVPVAGSAAPVVQLPVAGAAAATTADGHPLTRREALAAEHGHLETGHAQVGPGRTTGEVAVVAPDSSQGVTGVSWLLGLIPVVALVLALVAGYVYFYVSSSPLVALLGLAPYLLGVLWALADSRQLAARGFRAPSALWAFLTPLVYLIVRRIRVPRTGPLLLFLITAVLVVAVPAGVFATGNARMVTVALDVQRTAVSQFVDTGRLETVSCPPFVESLEPGTLFTCQATLSGGAATQVWVSIDDPDGSFSIAPAI